MIFFPNNLNSNQEIRTTCFWKRFLTINLYKSTLMYSEVNGIEGIIHGSFSPDKRNRKLHLS
jgi:hypothetical protein